MKEETIVRLLLGLLSSAPEKETFDLPGTSLAKSTAASAAEATSAAHWPREALSTNLSFSIFFAKSASPAPPAAAKPAAVEAGGGEQGAFLF